MADKPERYITISHFNGRATPIAIGPKGWGSLCPVTTVEAAERIGKGIAYVLDIPYIHKEPR